MKDLFFCILNRVVWFHTESKMVGIEMMDTNGFNSRVYFWKALYSQHERQRKEGRGVFFSFVSYTLKSLHYLKNLYQ